MTTSVTGHSITSQWTDDDLASLSISRRIKAYHERSTKNRAKMLRDVGLFDELDLAEDHGVSTTAQFLMREHRLPPATAYEYVRIAKGLREFEVLYSVFEEGQIPYSTVRFLLPKLTAENEIALVSLALKLTFAELVQALAGVGVADSEDGPEEPFVDTRVRDDGMLAINMLLPPVAGQEFLAALKIAELANHGIEDLDTDALLDEETVEQLLEEAEGIEEVCPGEQIAEPDDDTKLTMEKILNLPSRYGPPEKSAMFPALMAMVQMVRSNPMSPLRSPGAQVNIMVTEDGRCWMPQNPSAASEEIRSYVSNAMTRMHYLDKRGLTLNVSRAQRFATDGQVQALLAVWGFQCAMPGCTHTRFIQIHHIREWEHGGATNMDNLIPLCSSCHSNVSHGIVRIEPAGPDLLFKFKDGSQFISRNRTLPERAQNFRGKLIIPEAVEGTSFDG